MDNPNTISYADDWKEAYNPVYKEEKPENDVIEKKKERKNTGKPLLIIIQLIVFAIIVLSAYCIKTFGGGLYNTLNQWYYNTLNDQIILTESFDSFSIDKVFDSNEQS